MGGGQQTGGGVPQPEYRRRCRGCGTSATCDGPAEHSPDGCGERRDYQHSGAEEPSQDECHHQRQEHDGCAARGQQASEPPGGRGQSYRGPQFGDTAELCGDRRHGGHGGAVALSAGLPEAGADHGRARCPGGRHRWLLADGSRPGEGDVSAASGGKGGAQPATGAD